MSWGECVVVLAVMVLLFDVSDYVKIFRFFRALRRSCEQWMARFD